MSTVTPDSFAGSLLPAQGSVATALASYNLLSCLACLLSPHPRSCFVRFPSSVTLELFRLSWGRGKGGAVFESVTHRLVVWVPKGSTSCDAGTEGAGESFLFLFCILDTWVQVPFSFLSFQSWDVFTSDKVD